jgi:hypothetical protein
MDVESETKPSAGMGSAAWMAYRRDGDGGSVRVGQGHAKSMKFMMHKHKTWKYYSVQNWPEVEEEINNLRVMNGKDSAKYATSATDNKLTISEGKLTVYIVLKSSPGKKHRNFCTRGNWNHKSTDVARMKFIEKCERDGTDGKDEKDEKDERDEKDEDEKDEKDGKDVKNRKV